MKKAILFIGACLLGLSFADIAFADIPSPSLTPYIHQLHSMCIPSLDGLCNRGIHVDWQILFESIIFFLAGTILIELPVFYAFGFNTKKRIGLVILANVISVIAYHTINAITLGSIGVLIFELLITIFESLFLIMFLRKELSLKKIIIATAVANIASFILGYTILFFIPIPFFYV